MTISKKKILLIDDDPYVREALSLLLEDDYQTFSASTAAEGVDRFKELLPNVVILDLHLPDENGLAALRRIRNVDRFARVIILTGFANLESVEESMRLGASDCLHKPCDARALKSRLKELLIDPATQVEEPADSGSKVSEDLVAASFLHDISNPLTSLQALSSVLMERNSNPEVAKLAAMMDQNISYLGSLVEQWKALSSSKSLGADYASLGDIAQISANFVRGRAEVKGVELSVELKDVSALPALNRHAVVRILVNVLQNAIDAAPEERGVVCFCGSVRNGMIEFSVSDNGDGVSPELRQKIFLPNYTTKTQGTGLGLYIARKIVEAAAGSISICSRPKRGATFTVQLPSCS
ncbi:hybrid sensor histidine kinase/response regulator [Pelagicoccus albus]|uniref:histidine kinase n=1 Tax=Pelagicoccus albus TaxID=415222 RepID=A0A7X1E792_9BACT|nr:hybrid sensor histidine kinase/response regulator [Pelagicoccus albus]MBC2604941.1 hybrid sensor histidine kinase/response regulator [Pelagicoccus albus]